MEMCNILSVAKKVEKHLSVLA